MSKRRPKILEARWFSFVIAAFIVGIIMLLYFNTLIFQGLENGLLDTHFNLKDGIFSSVVQEGAVLSESNAKTSGDILIIGIDNKSLSKYGKWPFARRHHADLINAFSRISDQANRESAFFMDVFLNEPDYAATDDALVVQAMKDSNRVFNETIITAGNPATENDPIRSRQNVLSKKWGVVRNVRGEWKEMPAAYGLDAPLIPFAEATYGYGHANFLSDPDGIFRRQPLLFKSSELLKTIRLDELAIGFSVNEDAFERLAWFDNKGDEHTIATPVTQSALAKLRAQMQKNAPLKVEDKNQDGTPDDEYYIVRHYRDSFIPSITLSLAVNYFHKTLEDLEVVLGKYILIPSPMMPSADSGELEPYRIQVTPDKYDADNNLVKEGERRTLREIRIPINENAQMLVNFMGKRSSETSDGAQTFPVRSYSAYADRAPGPDPALWKKTLAVKNKILMVGAFSTGVADDEKPTPRGLMFGIEIHANALNTMIMDNFIHESPRWLNMCILVGLAFLVAFYSSRMPAIGAFALTLVGLSVFFGVVTFTFDLRSYLLDFSTPFIAMIFTFISVVVYRVFTEERDKRQIRETFGKYLSPDVVKDLAENPPELGGVDKVLTVQFSDIRGFTTLSETLPPQELVNHLNLYLGAMTEILIEYRGTLDKYIGDAVMGFWGAPIPQTDHAVLACKCALAQIRKLEELNAGWPENKVIHIGIGLNSGIMTVANVGCNARLSYTVMGDNVNLASRLEATNKEYSTEIIISEGTYELVKDLFVVRELDNIRVKGKNKPVIIYELVDCIGDISPPAKIKPSRK